MTKRAAKNSRVSHSTLSKTWCSSWGVAMVMSAMAPMHAIHAVSMWWRGCRKNMSRTEPRTTPDFARRTGSVMGYLGGSG
jgi:hypothetical protein